MAVVPDYFKPETKPAPLQQRIPEPVACGILAVACNIFRLNPTLSSVFATLAILFGATAIIAGIWDLWKKRRRGVALAGCLMGVFALLMVAFVGSFDSRVNVEMARRHGTMSGISGLVVELEAFKKDSGRYPTTAEGLDALVHAPAGMAMWNGPYIDRVPTDTWGNPFFYAFPGGSDPATFDLHSMGHDQLDGTDDDIDRNTSSD